MNVQLWKDDNDENNDILIMMMKMTV